MMDFYYPIQKTRNSVGFDYPGHYNLTPIWQIITQELPKKTTKDDYPSFPKCRHIITESGDTRLELATSGFKRDELNVKIEDDSIVVSGKRKAEDTGNKKKEQIIFSSISGQSFESRYQLSEKFDLARVESTYGDGLLVITIPLSEDIKKKNRDIEIK
jgi:HSP20 family molecular chaperone IbpA